MSNPFDGDDNDDANVLEGFLCPMCKEDLKSPDRLTTHFDNVHSNDDDQDFIKSFKDIFITAKNKIKRFDDAVTTATAGGTDGASRSQQHRFNVRAPVYPQDIGVDFSHFVFFKEVRAPRLERFATETNKLIIRLHKLLTDLPADPAQRKQHEKNIVPWLDGESVKLCPSCVRRFYLTRRQHHCRLCGTIMCHDCSMSLEIRDAMRIVNPSSEESSRHESNENERKDEALRVCEHCLHLLRNRMEMQESRNCRPPITRYYEKIAELKKDIAPDAKMYTKIVDRLSEGDPIYTLADASALRAKIGHVAELIDKYSKAILTLQYDHGQREVALKEAIRLACIKYIKDELVSLSPLPTAERIKQLQDQRRTETEMRIERERRLALEAIEKYELLDATGNLPVAQTHLDKFASGTAVRSLDNWIGSQVDPTSSSSDPYIDQINNIKGLIKQARDALRFEEVETLQLHLQELQQEFYNRQQQMYADAATKSTSE